MCASIKKAIDHIALRIWQTPVVQNHCGDIRVNIRNGVSPREEFLSAFFRESSGVTLWYAHFVNICSFGNTVAINTEFQTENIPAFHRVLLRMQFHRAENTAHQNRCSASSRNVVNGTGVFHNSDSANKTAAASELPPPNPAPTGIFLQKNIHALCVFVSFETAVLPAHISWTNRGEVACYWSAMKCLLYAALIQFRQKIDAMKDRFNIVKLVCAFPHNTQSEIYFCIRAHEH